jgi:hypothetical protein
MDGPALLASLQQAVPAATFESAASVDLQTTIYVSREHVVDVARALRSAPDLKFTFLAELTAVDVWPREPRFEVVYVLVSIEHRLRLRMKVRLHGSDAHLATLTRTRGLGSVRDRVRRASRSAASADAGRLGRISASERLARADPAASARDRGAAGHAGRVRRQRRTRSVDPPWLKRRPRNRHPASARKP